MWDILFWTILLTLIIIVLTASYVLPNSPFSFQTSFSHLMQTTKRMILIDGIRSIAMQFILIIHASAQTYNLSLDDSLQTECSTHQRPIWFLRSVYLHINLIFIMTGYLNFYELYHKVRLRQHIPILELCIKRFLRFWPVLGLAILFNAGPFSKMYSHPRWLESVGLDRQSCRMNWWATLFFVNTIYEPQDIVSYNHLVI